MLVAPHTPVPAVIIKKCPQILLNLPWEKNFTLFALARGTQLVGISSYEAKVHRFNYWVRHEAGWSVWCPIRANARSIRSVLLCHINVSLLSLPLSPSTALSINPWACPHIKFKQSHPWLKTTILDLKPMVLSSHFTREVAECMVSHLFQK